MADRIAHWTYAAQMNPERLLRRNARPLWEYRDEQVQFIQSLDACKSGAFGDIRATTLLTRSFAWLMRIHKHLFPMTAPFPSLAACLVVFVLQSTEIRAADSADLKPIFNGKDLTGWQVPNPNPFWRVVDGVLVGENDAEMKGHVLYTDKAYKDFVFETEARWNGEIDSGIMLRKPELQLQIGISRSLKKDMTCSFYTNGKEKYPEAGQAKDLNKYLKPGDWNKIRLETKGDTFTAWLNDQKVVEYTDSRYPHPFAIGLQIHPGLKMKIEFRNIRLKNMDETK